LGRIEDAEEVYTKLLELDPTMMEGWLDWSYVKFTKGEIEEALDMLREAVKMDYECHNYHYRMVCYLFELGKIQEAKKHLEIALILCYDDMFLMFEISPKLRKNTEVMELIIQYKLE